MSQNIGSELPPLSMEKNEAKPEFASPENIMGAERTENQMVKAIETGQSVSAMPPAQAAFTASSSTPAQTPLTTVDDTATDHPMIADDADLIEKEWVLKAKAIVERTRQDPYLQNKEVEKIKADYMKKRYNKEVKLTED